MPLKSKFFASLLIFTALILTGCGFHLRSDKELPLQLRVLYVHSSDPYGEFTLSLKKTLQQVGVTLVNSPQDAPATLDILQSSLAYPASTAGTSSQATVYVVTYTAILDLIDAKGKKIIANESVSSTTTMIVNAQQPLSSTNQLETTSQQLQRNVIMKIFDILSSPAAHQIPEKSKSKNENRH